MVSESIIHSASARRIGAVAPLGPTGITIVLLNVFSSSLASLRVASVCAFSNAVTIAVMSPVGGVIVGGSSLGTVRMGSITICESVSVHATSVGRWERSENLSFDCAGGDALSTRSVGWYSRSNDARYRSRSVVGCAVVAIRSSLSVAVHAPPVVTGGQRSAGRITQYTLRNDSIDIGS